MATTHPKIAEWQAWLKVVNAEIVGLFHDRHLFMAMMDMIANNPHLPKKSVVYEWLINAFVVSAVAGVRRQLDLRPDVISLNRLLHDIVNNPTALTRAWFVAQYGALPNGDRDFDKFANAGSQHLDLSRLQQDIDTLEKTGEAIRVYANKYVAHRDEAIATKQVTSPPVLKWKELHEALRVLGELLQRYELLLNQRGMLRVEPVIQEDWERLFAVPWRA